ncbi:hypothetical protein [Paenibacillus sp. A14]|uniref:hypothetical protein n=1 Tax=Paenibacillus sp. A14 TaxID=3119820 RepID=UPI002FE3C173
MSNPLSKIAAALLALILLFLYPAVEFAQREADFEMLSAYNSLVQFTDAVRNKGYFSPEMYRGFSRDLEMGGNVYDIEIEHRRKKYHPEYGDPADPATFQGRYSVVYDSYYTDRILEVLFPANASGTEAEERLYKLAAGDFVQVTLKPKTRPTSHALADLVYGPGNRSEAGKRITYGGMVLNEDY